MKATIGFPQLLTLIFITLKLTGHISWSWWWVLAPVWAPVAVLLALAASCLVFAGLLTFIEKITK
jgi:hypothetical protein